MITGAELLGVTPAQALEAYGEYFVGYVSKQGYDRLMACLGSNLAHFLLNLNNLHLHLCGATRTHGTAVAHSRGAAAAAHAAV